MDVHVLQPGSVSFQDVMEAHKKDLAVEKKYDVDFQKFWVDEKKGLVYCLSSAPNEEAIKKTHAEAHGLIPANIYSVTAGQASAMKGNQPLFIDRHELGAGAVKASDVAAAHVKDLNVEGKYGVNFINYWVAAKEGVILCLSEAADTSSVISTHKEAHGLLPMAVMTVKQGQ
jgi:hypothetical protein